MLIRRYVTEAIFSGPWVRFPGLHVLQMWLISLAYTGTYLSLSIDPIDITLHHNSVI